MNKVNHRKPTNLRSGINMRKLIEISVFALLVLATGVWATQSWGGAWLVPRKMGYTSSMGTIEQSFNATASSGAVLLNVSYHTMFDSVAAGDSMYTVGLGDDDDYSPDSSGGDDNPLTPDTTALALDGYIGQNMQVSFFFMGTSGDTLFITVEQALRYDSDMGDSGFAYGFKTTDTLFVDSLQATKDSLIVLTVSGQGEASRHYTDNFEVIAPYVRFKFKNMGKVAANRVHIEMFALHEDEIMSGSGSRIQHRIDRTIKPSRGRRGLP